MSNSLDPGQACGFVRPDLGPKCLQRLSADGKGLTLVLLIFYLLHSSLVLSYLLANIMVTNAGPCSEVDNVSGNRSESDCRSRGRGFDPGPVPYFRGD